MAPVQMEGDRVGAGVQALLRQVLPELEDLVLEVLGCPLRARPGPAGARHEARLTFGLEPADQFMDPSP